MTTGAQGFEAEELAGVISAEPEIGLGAAIRNDMAAQAAERALKDAPMPAI